MFTGLVSDIGDVVVCERKGDLARIRIHCGYRAETLAIGASIACSGPCLTVVAAGSEHGRSFFEVEAAAETLARTTAGTWFAGQRVNLERSLKMGDELGGHLVTGHIDGLARVVEREAVSGAECLKLQAPRALARFIAEKGSVALDGVSLTVNAVERVRFSVLVIPHTLAVTNLSDRQPGDDMNLEVDLLARYAARLMER